MYFPSFNETNIACHECERKECPSRGKHQRNRRDFTFTSGRCPKLPDRRGFVDISERDKQRKAYPLVYAESNGESVFLTLSLPDEKRLKKVYQTKSGYWYFKTKDSFGFAIKQVIVMVGYYSFDDILAYMEQVNSDYCILPCEITDFTV